MNKMSLRAELLKADMDLVQKYMPRSEFWALVQGMKGEEARHFVDIFRGVAETVRAMPGEVPLGLRDRQTAHLHYFRGDSDWYILSKGTLENPYPHGFTILNGDGWDAEYGDLSIHEITSAGAELDLYWTPKPMYEVKAKHELSVDTPEELLDLENEKLVKLFSGQSQYVRTLRDKVANNIRALPRTPPAGPHENNTAFIRLTREEYPRQAKGNNPAKLVSWYVMSSGDNGKYPFPYCLAVIHDNPRASKLGFVSLDEITWAGAGIPPAVLDLNYEPEKLADIEARYGITHLKGKGISPRESNEQRVEFLSEEEEAGLEPEPEP